VTTFLTDVRHAIRGLWRSKTFAVVAIACLGLGIGLNTTIFSIVDGVLLQPYPFHEPDRLIVLGERNPKSGSESGLSYRNLVDWKSASTALTTIGVSSGRPLTLSNDGAGEPERLTAAAISWDLFPELGVSPMLGRPFREDDDRPGAAGVVLISHDLWTIRYQADPRIVGRTAHVDGRPHTIVGVMPPGFRFPTSMRLWVPVTPLVHEGPRSTRNLFAFGRLKPGVTFDQAVQDLSGVADRLAREYPATNEGWTVWPRDLRDAFLPDDVVEIVLLMMAAVTLVLFIACSNVANLLLVRASVRRREFALRAALGAGRGRIIRQLLTESVVLGLASVPLGLALAEIGTRLIAAALPVDAVPYYIHFRVDWRTGLYSIAVAVVTALIFGVAPVFQVSRGSLRQGLEDSARGSTTGRSWLRSSLVVVQVSLALVALVGALLFVRTFLNFAGFDFGYSTRPLMTMRIAMQGESYEPTDARLRRVSDIVDRVEALPGVEAAFASNLVPLGGGGGWGGAVTIEGKPPEAGAEVSLTGVSPHFYKTLGVKLVAGRDFTDAEGETASSVAVINQAMSRRFWPDADPIGRRFRTAQGLQITDWLTVIGVAPDIRLYGVNPGDIEQTPAVFVSYAHQQTISTGLTIRVAAGNPAAITTAVRAAIRTSDPNIPVSQVRTMDEVRRLNFWEFGLYGWIFGLTGAVGLLLAAVGVYGVLSYSVAQRTREIGVRVALGASSSQVRRLVVRSGVSLVAVGIAIGLVTAFIAMPAVRNQLFEVSPFDPLTFAAVSGLLLSVAFLASYMPALRATKVDPIVVLKGE
jgi:putative ABC transport system permease protein